MNGLVVSDLLVRYGGHKAVDEVTLDAPERRLTALIGPNGAGKTTIFNACTGLLSPSGGGVELFGHDVTRWPPERRGRAGLGRTFQRMELFDSMTVRENVGLGLEASLAGSNPLRHLRSSRAERTRVDEAVERALSDCSITEIASRPAGSLSTGQRRLVELARVIAGDFRLLLLDEPSSGLDHGESVAFGRLLQRLVRDRAVGILLVEHDMSLVLDVAEHVWVLDFGRLLFAGTPEQVRKSPQVRAAYLGEAA